MNTLIVLTVIAIVGSGEARGLVTNKPPTVHPVVAGFFVGLVLYVIALASSDVAAKLCYLFMAVSLIVNGGPIVTALNNGTNIQSPIGKGHSGPVAKGAPIGKGISGPVPKGVYV